MPKLAHASNRESTPLNTVQSRPLLSSDLVQTPSSQGLITSQLPEIMAKK